MSICSNKQNSNMVQSGFKVIIQSNMHFTKQNLKVFCVNISNDITTDGSNILIELKTLF